VLFIPAQIIVIANRHCVSLVRWGYGVDALYLGLQCSVAGEDGLYDLAVFSGFVVSLDLGDIALRF
jgi:hypothetical protein